VATFPETEEGSGEMGKDPACALTGVDHKEMVKHRRKRVAMETAVRKRMMEYTSNIMGFDWDRNKDARRMPKGSRNRRDGGERKETR